MTPTLATAICWASLFPPQLPQPVPHPWPQGTCEHLRALSSYLPLHLLKIQLQGLCQDLTSPVHTSFPTYSFGHTRLRQLSQQHNTFPPWGLCAYGSLCLGQSSPCDSHKTDSISVQSTAQRSPPQRGPLWVNSGSITLVSFLCLISYTGLPSAHHSVLVSFSQRPSPFL